jgi:ankyrin repeat protein
MMNPLQSATLFFSGHLPEPDKTPRLCRFALDALLSCVTENDGAGIRDLLQDEKNRGWVIAGFKKPDYSPLHHATAQGQGYAMQALVEHLPLELCEMPTPDLRRTPLMLAAEYGHADTIIKYRLAVREKYRDASVPADTGMMMYATHLLKSRLGYDSPASDWDARWSDIVNAKDGAGNTALILALDRGHYFCARILLAMQADPFCENDRGQSALSLVKSVPPDSPHRTLLLTGLPAEVRAGVSEAWSLPNRG